MRMRDVPNSPKSSSTWSSTLAGRWQKKAFDLVVDGYDPAFPAPVIGPYTEERTALRGALDSALIDGADPAKALAKADKELDEQLATYNQDVGG